MALFLVTEHLFTAYLISQFGSATCDNPTFWSQPVEINNEKH